MGKKTEPVTFSICLLIHMLTSYAGQEGPGVYPRLQKVDQEGPGAYSRMGCTNGQERPGAYPRLHKWSGRVWSLSQAAEVVWRGLEPLQVCTRLEKEIHVTWDEHANSIEQMGDSNPQP